MTSLRCMRWLLWASADVIPVNVAGGPTENTTHCAASVASPMTTRRKTTTPHRAIAGYGGAPSDAEHDRRVCIARRSSSSAPPAGLSERCGAHLREKLRRGQFYRAASCVRSCADCASLRRGSGVAAFIGFCVRWARSAVVIALLPCSGFRRQSVLRLCPVVLAAAC